MWHVVFAEARATAAVARGAIPRCCYSSRVRAAGRGLRRASPQKSKPQARRQKSIATPASDELMSGAKSNAFRCVR